MSTLQSDDNAKEQPSNSTTGHSNSISYADHRIRLLLTNEKLMQKRLGYDEYKEKYKNNMEMAFGKDEDAENKKFRKELDKEREKKLSQGLNHQNLRKKKHKSKTKKHRNKNREHKHRSRKHSDLDASDYSSDDSIDLKRKRSKYRRRKDESDTSQSRSRSRSRSRSKKRKQSKKHKRKRKTSQTDANNGINTKDFGANHPFNSDTKKNALSNIMRHRFK